MANLFSPELYSQVAALGDIFPEVPRLILEYQKPKDEEAAKINDLLVRIFNDSQLHTSIRASGRMVSFGEHTKDHSYIGFYRLVITHIERMILIRQELQFMADHGDETEFKDYNLFQTENGIFYVQIRKGKAPGEPSQWKEGVLAANDLRGYEWPPQHDKSKLPTPDSILKSLEEAISTLAR